MSDRLFQGQEFGIPGPGTATVFFICPYSATIKMVRLAILCLVRNGFHVVAYETTNSVFTDGDPAILPVLIAALRDHVRARIAGLTAAGVTDFGFFGSSLGSFIFYNCVGQAVPELRWGVFNTGGNIARGMWRMASLQQAHVAAGWSLPRLEEAWAGVQYPDFGRLDGCRFVFSSSRWDSVAPLAEIPKYLGPMLAAGASVRVREVPAWNHRSTVIAGLALAPWLIRTVRRSPSGPGSRT
jgi:hypothetical protein